MQAFRTPLFGLSYALRKKNSFMKRLGVFHWRIGKNQRNKNPHPLKMQHIQTMKRQKEQDRINELKRNSSKPFGKFTKHGRFILDKEQIPFYNIPDLSGFQVDAISKVVEAVLPKKEIVHKIPGPAQPRVQSGGGLMRRLLDPLSSLKK